MTAKPSASEQHRPLPLLRASNHGFSGDLAWRPSSRAGAFPSSSAANSPTTTEVLKTFKPMSPPKRFRSLRIHKSVPDSQIRRRPEVPSADDHRHGLGRSKFGQRGLWEAIRTVANLVAPVDMRDWSKP